MPPRWAGLGSPHRQPDSRGSVVSRAAVRTNQQSQSLSSHSGSTGVPDAGPESSRSRHDRHHHSRRSYQEAVLSLHNTFLVASIIMIADRLSRRLILFRWSGLLSPAVASSVWRVWGSPHGNLFATPKNAKLPTNVSPLPDTTVWETDTLSFSWKRIWGYAFPPFPLLREILEKVSRIMRPAPERSSLANPVLVPAASGSTDRPSFDNLTAPQAARRGVFHDNPTMLHLHAWSPRSPRSPRVSPLRWLSRLHLLTDLVPSI